MYKLEITRSAKKDLKIIDRQYQAFILDSLEDFVRNFNNTNYETSLIQNGTIKKLQGQKEILYRLKLRSYRIVYKKYEDKLVILVLHATTREGAYK